MVHILLCVAGIQEGSECTKCKNDWALRAAIALLYVLCALLTIAVAVLGYKGESRQMCSSETKATVLRYSAELSQQNSNADIFWFFEALRVFEMCSSKVRLMY